MNLQQTGPEVNAAERANPTAEPVVTAVPPGLESGGKPPDGVATPPGEPSLDDPNHPWRRAAGILGLGACRLARSHQAGQPKTRAGSDARADKVEAGERRGRQRAKRKAGGAARKRRTA